MAALDHDVAGNNQGDVQRIDDVQPRQLDPETHASYPADDIPECTTVGSRHMQGVYLGITTAQYIPHTKQNPHTSYISPNALHGGNVQQLGVPCTHDADFDVVSKGSSSRSCSDRRLVVPRFPATRTSVKLNAYEADGNCGVAIGKRVRIYFRLESESGCPSILVLLPLIASHGTVIPVGVFGSEGGVSGAKRAGEAPTLPGAQLNKQFSEVVHT